MHGLVIGALVGAMAAMQASSLSLRSSPEQPYVETLAHGVAIQGDLVVHNGGERDWELIELHMDVRDAAGALVQRKELNLNGPSPSILTIADREVAAGEMLVVYNPFATFAADIPVARLDYRLVFRVAGGEETATAEISVTPRLGPAATFRFPLVGRALVWDGHDFYSHHRRWNYGHPILRQAGYTTTAGRYSYDLILVDEEGRRSTGDEAINANWPSFGAPVLATADGVVVAVEGGRPDDRTFDFRPGQTMVPNSSFGNHVVIRHDDGTHSLFGHLMQGSPSVAPGERVSAGQAIGRVGASGSSLFPHLHYQRTEGPDDFSEGVPVRWDGVSRAIGERREPIAHGYIDSGDIVIAE